MQKSPRCAHSLVFFNAIAELEIFGRHNGTKNFFKQSAIKKL